MIQLYAKGTTDFSKNGISLRPQESTVTFRDNGQWDIEIVVNAESEYTSFDYGMILRVTVPEQNVAAINLGTVTNWTISKSGGTNLYSEIPTLRTVSYSQWWYSLYGGETQASYSVGDKVSFNNRNYQCNTWDSTSPQCAVPPNNNGWWTEIPRTTGSAGKVIATLDYGTTIMKVSDFNDNYMEVATLNKKQGYVLKSDCTSTGTSESRVIPARTITEQNFVITEIRKEQSGKAIRVSGEHISYQLGRTILGDCNVVGVTPATAVLFIQGAMQEEYSGEIYTNITDVTIDADWSWLNAQNAIMDPKNGLLALTGGRMIRDDLDVFVLSEGTPDPKYAVRYGANMTSVKWTGDVGDIVTRIYPIAQTEDGSTLLLPEKYIDTARTIPFVRPEVLDTKLKIGQKVKNSDGTETELTESEVFTRMREQANNRFNIDKCDQAEVNLDLDWVHMPDTEEYSQYTALKNAAPGDWVEVANGPLGISENIRMTGYTWDPIVERYKGATFGPNKEKATVAGYSLQSGSVSARVIANGAVGSGAIQQGSITAREIETNSLTADKIASKSITTELIMAGAITADEINANAVTADKIAAGSVTTAKLDAGAVTADKIAAGAINADKIDANAITAIVAKLGVAHITNGVIDNASIGFANIVDASVQSLIARDAVTDKYYIDKLAVRNAQMVEATVGELVIKASDNNYYRLDIDEYGMLSPTQVTLTAAEIAAGETSDGHGAIIETDLTVADLSASNMKAINALIDKLTASRIDVDELWARQAFINKLMVQDISSNTYIQATIGNWSSQSTITQSIDSLDSRISSLGYGTVYMQPEEPSHSELVPGDIWIQTQASGTWEQVYQDYASWQEIYNTVSTWQTLGGVSIMWVWDGRKWQEQLNALDSDTFETEIAQNAHDIQLLATQMNDKYTIRSGIAIEAAGVTVSGSQYVVIQSGGYFQVTTGNFGIDTNSSTYVMWSGAASAANSPFWLKKSGEIYAISGTIGGFTLAANSLSSGSTTTYVNINILQRFRVCHIHSNSSNTYAMWAGAEAVTNAPYRLKRDGTVYLTSLIAVGENGSETTVNLRTAGLWKLSYNTIKSYTSDSITLSNGATINFIKASEVTISAGLRLGSDGKSYDYRGVATGAISKTGEWTNTGTVVYNNGVAAGEAKFTQQSGLRIYQQGGTILKCDTSDTIFYSGKTYYASAGQVNLGTYTTSNDFYLKTTA